VGLEGAALRHHHSCLILDELGAFAGTPQQAAGIIYELLNGLAKGRGKADGTDRARASFDLMLFSTGEVTLADMLAQDRRAAAGGQQVRLLALPAVPSLKRSPADRAHGVFEDLHGMTGAELSDHLRSKARLHYGTALPAFVGGLQGMEEAAVATAIRTAVLRLHALIRAEYHVPDVPAQIGRMLDRLALCMAAGSLAAEMDILPWPKGEAERAIEQIVLEWIDERGLEAGEQTTVVEHVRRVLFSERDRFVEARRNGRHAWSSGRVVQHRLGYLMEGDYLVPPGVFDQEMVPKGVAARVARKQLADAGWLVTERAGEVERLTVRVDVPDEGGETHRARYIRIKGAILGGDDGASV
jgi:putative DNA primase/helicase